MVRRKCAGLLFEKAAVYAGPAPRPGLLEELYVRVPGLLQNEREIHRHLNIFVLFKILSGFRAETLRRKELPEQEQLTGQLFVSFLHIDRFVPDGIHPFEFLRRWIHITRVFLDVGDLFRPGFPSYRCRDLVVRPIYVVLAQSD